MELYRGHSNAQLAAIRACATLFGGIVLYTFEFSAFVFRALPAAEAGAMLRAAFPYYYAFVIGGGAVAALIALATTALNAALLAAVAVSAVYARQVLMPQINAARDAQMAGEAAAARRFNLLHGWSVVLNLLQLGAIGYVLVSFT